MQRPYGIGDRINIASPNSSTSSYGSQTWIDKDITLFTTTMFLGATVEVATVSNGALAQSRIINFARSPQAEVVVTIKIAMDTPYEKVKKFKSGLERFIKSKPREWVRYFGGYARQIDPEEGYIAFDFYLKHRDSWQGVVGIAESRSRVYCFCLELCKRLGIRYRSPPLPVDLNVIGGVSLGGIGGGNIGDGGGSDARGGGLGPLLQRHHATRFSDVSRSERQIGEEHDEGAVAGSGRTSGIGRQRRSNNNNMGYSTKRTSSAGFQELLTMFDD